MIVFGGFDGSAGAAEGGTSRDFRDDVWILHTVDETGTEAFAWESCPRPSGRRSRETCWPKPRSGHSCSVLGSQMFVFGGRSSEGRFRDTHALNTGEPLPTPPSPWALRKGLPPSRPPLAVRTLGSGNACCTPVGLCLPTARPRAERLADTMTWSLVETMGQAPCARKTHAMARAGDRIFVVGGHDGTAAGWLDDFFILHVGGVGRAGAGSLGLLAEFVPASSSAARTDGGSSLRHDLAELLDLDLEGDLLSPPAPLDGTSDVFGSPPQNAKQAAEPSTPGMAAPAPAAAASASASSRSAGAGGPRSWGGDDDDRVARGAPSPSIPGLRAGFVASLPERRSFDQDWGSKTRLGDVTFIVQGRRVVLHKCVLAARSEYYRRESPHPASPCPGTARVTAPLHRPAVPMLSPTPPPCLLAPADMFLSDMAEASDAHPVIPLVDVPIPIFLALVRYIYTDRLPPRPVRDRLVPGLLQQAQKLGMVRLSVLCQQHLASRLSVHNAIAMLDAADTHGAIPLRRAAFVFVLDNFAAVSKTLPFLQLRGDLLRHIMWRRARRRSKPEDRRTLTWQAVEDGLDDVDKAQEIVFPVTDEEAEASNVDQAAGAAGEASAADGGKGSTPGLMSSSSSSAASTHVPIGPSAATKRLSSLLRPGSGSQSAATAFAAVLEGASSISRAAKRPSDGEDSESKRSHHSETSCSRSADGHGASSRARMALSEAEDPDHADSEHAEDSDASSQASPTHEELRGRRTSRGSGGVRGHGNDGSNDSTDGPSLMDEAPRAAMGAGAGQAPSSASSEASRSRRQ